MGGAYEVASNKLESERRSALHPTTELRVVLGQYRVSAPVTVDVEHLFGKMRRILGDHGKSSDQWAENARIKAIVDRRADEEQEVVQLARESWARAFGGASFGWPKRKSAEAAGTPTSEAEWIRKSKIERRTVEAFRDNALADAKKQPGMTAALEKILDVPSIAVGWSLPPFQAGSKVFHESGLAIQHLDALSAEVVDKPWLAEFIVVDSLASDDHSVHNMLSKPTHVAAALVGAHVVTPRYFDWAVGANQDGGASMSFKQATRTPRWIYMGEEFQRTHHIIANIVKEASALPTAKWRILPDMAAVERVQRTPMQPHMWCLLSDRDNRDRMDAKNVKTLDMFILELSRCRC